MKHYAVDIAVEADEENVEVSAKALAAAAEAAIERPGVEVVAFGYSIRANGQPESLTGLRGSLWRLGRTVTSWAEGV